MFKHQHLQMLSRKLNSVKQNINICNFRLLEVVDRDSETQLQVGENLNKILSGQRVIH